MCTVILITSSCGRCDKQYKPQEKTTHCELASFIPALKMCPSDECYYPDRHETIAWESCKKCWAEHLAKLEEEKKNEAQTK